MTSPPSNNNNTASRDSHLFYSQLEAIMITIESAVYDASVPNPLSTSSSSSMPYNQTTSSSSRRDIPGGYQSKMDIDTFTTSNSGPLTFMTDDCNNSEEANRVINPTLDVDIEMSSKR